MAVMDEHPKQKMADYDADKLREHLDSVEAMLPLTRQLLSKAVKSKGRKLHGFLGGFERAERAMIAARRGIDAICVSIDRDKIASQNQKK